MSEAERCLIKQHPHKNYRLISPKWLKVNRALCLMSDVETDKETQDNSGIELNFDGIKILLVDDEPDNL